MDQKVDKMAPGHELLEHVGPVQLRTYKLKDIWPNPFRDMSQYPINQTKVEKLRESVRATGFWSNVLTRTSAKNPNKVEQAYGHSRRDALVKEYGLEHEVQVLVATVPDAVMLRIMAHENQQEWGATPLVQMETLRATVNAYAKGIIEFGPLDDRAPKDGLRYAPGYIQGLSPPNLRGDKGQLSKPYVATQITDFLQFPRKANGGASEEVLAALTALELMEVGAITQAEVEGLSYPQFAAMVKRARTEWRQRQDKVREQERRADDAEQRTKTAKNDAEHQEAKRTAERERKKVEREREAAAKGTKKVADEMAKTYRGKGGSRKAKAAADKASARGRRNTLKGLDQFGREVINSIDKLLFEDVLVEKLDSLLHPDAVGEVPAKLKTEISASLKLAGERALAYAGRFRDAAEPKARTVTPPARKQLEV